MSFPEKLKEVVEYCKANNGYRVTTGCAPKKLLLVHNITGRVFVSAEALPGLR